jgi:S-adenosylmethionine:tRNA ribosyltransferase-isomerase
VGFQDDLFPETRYKFAMRTADFDFDLPAELVAQVPAKERDQSRLLVFLRSDASIQHRRFRQLLDYLRSGDIMVLNDSRVIPARLRGRNRRTKGEFEILLLEENEPNDWWAMMRPGKRARLQTEIEFQNRHGEITNVNATIIATNAEGHRRLSFTGTKNIIEQLDDLGEVPLPPYIKRDPTTGPTNDAQRYQTVYAREKGSVAAPTAGLHFTAELLEDIRRMGVEVCHITLHVGLGTFAPVKADTVADHVMHEERFVVTEEAARAVNTAKRERRRVIAVGTTSLRVLESAVDPASGLVKPGAGRTRIFIHPPFVCKVVDALLTNFHLPRSTLLMLVSAFAAPGEKRGRELILSAYAEAIRQHYRFFSYGDAMLIL